MAHPEIIQIVDEHDQPSGGATKHEAWEKGLIHRVVRIMIEDKAGRVLLQKRSKTQELFPGRWDNSVAGHVDEGEPYLDATKRELTEELGLKDCPITEAGYYFVDFTWEGKRMRRFTTNYKVILDETTPLTLQAAEVSETKWFSVEEIKKMINEHPDQVSDGLQQVFERFY
jgi:isopentenyl-diphosphate Delta-isomerase